MAVSDDAPYAFRDPNVPAEARISNLLTLLTPDEKIGLLSTNLGVPRLGIPGVENVEGIHGLVVTGFLGGGKIDIPSTTFPQPYGMAQRRVHIGAGACCIHYNHKGDYEAAEKVNGEVAIHFIAI